MERPSAGADPIAEARYYNQADVRILINSSNQVTIKNKSDVTVTATSTGNDKKLYDVFSAAVAVDTSSNGLIQDNREGARLRVASLDMEKVYKALVQHLRHDKAKTTVVRISELGLVEMTRKRTRESLGRTLYEPCFYCDGTGHLQSKTTIGHEILRQIRREKDSLPGFKVVVNAHPAVCDAMQREQKEAIAKASARYARQIVLTPRKDYHLEQFDLAGG